MNYDAETLREASEASGVPFDYLIRLAAAEKPDPQDPEGHNILAKQLAVIFDHAVAKCLAEPDTIGSLRRLGFEETADSLARRDS